MVSYVIAGASRGIGLAFVKELLGRGDTVFALARNPSSSQGLSQLKHDNLHVIQGDITDQASLKAAAAKVAEITGGSLDVLINNGAFQDLRYTFNSIVDFPNEDELVNNFNQSWTTNVLGPIITTNAFLPLLRKGSVKKVLTLSTGLADIKLTLEAKFAPQTAYSVSKSALEMVHAKYALALKKEEFTFLLISPGVVNTMEGPVPEEILPRIQEMFATFKTLYPEWTGPLEPSDSVQAMLKVLEKVKPEDSGAFLSHHGNKEWL